MALHCFLLILSCLLITADSFLDDGGFDPNAVNGFPPGPFNPNAGISTIPTPAISGGGSGGGGGSGFNPNAGQAITISPPTFSGFTGWGRGSGGQFNPNAGYSTSSPYGGGSFGGGWRFGGSGGAASRSGHTTRSAFGNGMWGYGTGPNGFNPNAGFTTGLPPTIPPAATTAQHKLTTRSPFSNFGNGDWGFGKGENGFNLNAGFTTWPPTIHPTTVTIPPTTTTTTTTITLPTFTFPWPESMAEDGFGTTKHERHLPITPKTYHGSNANKIVFSETKGYKVPTQTAGTLRPTAPGFIKFTNAIVE